jgi:PAS domain S-box-containing protein
VRVPASSKATNFQTTWVIRLFALMVFAIGSLGLSNWITGRQSSFPFDSPITMKTNTAIGILCLSIAVALLSLSPRGAFRVVARILGGVAFVIGTATLAQHLWKVDFGIDQLLFTEPPGAIATSSPNRMGPPSATMFSLLGLTLLLLPAPGKPGRNVQWLALLVLAMALIPLAGFVFGASDLYDLPNVTGIAPHTALCMILLSVAILLLRPDQAPVELLYRRDAGGEMARRLIPMAILLPPFAGLIVAEARSRDLLDIPMARVTMQVLLVVPMLGFVWWTARHLSSLSQARDRAERNFDRARVEAEGLAAQNVETTNLLDRLLDNAPVGMAIFDRSYRYVRVNPYLAEINGRSVVDHLGRPLGELFPEHAERFEGLISDVFTQGRSIEGIETLARTPSMPDVDRWFTCELFPVPDRNQHVALVGMVVMDVTESKRLDQQKAALLEVERAARAEAERIGLLKDEFLATLSHELRTPLTAIVGWAQILQSKAHEKKDLERGLETIDRNSKALSQLINDLLDVSRIINGKLHLNMLPLNIQAVVRAAIDSVTPSAQTKGIQLVSVLESAPLQVDGDPSRLQQVVWNLLTNAVKFTPRDGTIRITVRGVQQTVEIEVADTGIGVKPEFAQHMFQRFRQADASTTRRYGGLGLGLSIVRQLTELHGGTVSVSSEGLDRGASFVVTLPLMMPSSSPTKAETAARPARQTDGATLRGVRVMLVDDEPDTRTLICRILEEAGANVISAAGVDEALLRVELDQPHMLISDIGMPGKDGYELIRTVRARRSPTELPASNFTYANRWCPTSW